MLEDRVLVCCDGLEDICGVDSFVVQALGDAESLLVLAQLRFERHVRRGVLCVKCIAIRLVYSFVVFAKSKLSLNCLPFKLLSVILLLLIEKISPILPERQTRINVLVQLGNLVFGFAHVQTRLLGIRACHCICIA